MTDRELLAQALEALEKIAAYRPLTFAECSDAEAVMGIAEKAIPALRERLAQPQMQPCAGRNCGSTNPNLHSAECFEDYEKATGMAQPEQEPATKAGELRAMKDEFWKQPEQEHWDVIPDAFNEWWNADYDDTGNPYRKESPAYWAWSGWKAASKQQEQEPVAWIDAFGNVFPLGAQRGPKHLNEPMKPLYTAPPQRKPEQEPVANIRIWHKDGEQHAELWNWDKGIETLPDGNYDLYTAPPQRKPLTDEEIDKIYETKVWDARRSFARAIEAAHGIKENT